MNDTCRYCHESKPERAFYARSKDPTGKLYVRCLVCFFEYVLNPETDGVWRLWLRDKGHKSSVDVEHIRLLRRRLAERYEGMGLNAFAGMRRCHRVNREMVRKPVSFAQEQARKGRLTGG